MTTRLPLILLVLTTLLTGAVLAGPRSADALSVSQSYTQLAGFYRQWSSLDGPGRNKVRQVFEEMLRVSREYLELWRSDGEVLALDDDSLGVILELTVQIERQLDILTQAGPGGELSQVRARDFYGNELEKTASLFRGLGNRLAAQGL